MKTLPTLLLAALLASSVALSGCLAGIAGITGQTGSPSDDGDPLGSTTTPGATDGPGTPDTGNTNNTLPTSPPPVARMSIVDGSGAQVYKAEFEALDETGAPVLMKAGNVTLLATDSEALDGAKIESYEWTVTPGDHKASGRTVSFPLDKPDLYTIVLAVKDNRNGTDTQTVALGALPEAFTETVPFTGSILVGVEGQGVPANGAHAFSVRSATDEGRPLEVKGVTLTLTPTSAAAQNAADFVLALSGPDGEVDSADDGWLGEGETMSFATLAAGDYTATVSMLNGIAADYELSVSVTYLEVVEALQAASGDGHGHAH